MRAGLLDRWIYVQRVTTAETDSGAVTETWANVATLRAQLVQTSLEEFMRNYGASSEATITFRTRYLSGVTLADRVSYGGSAFHIKEIVEIGRRKGLELRCERVGQ